MCLDPPEVAGAKKSSRAELFEALAHQGPTSKFEWSGLMHV